MNFQELAQATNRELYQGCILCLDPGETTGYAVFDAGDLVAAGEFKSKPVELGFKETGNMIDKYLPWVIVVEEYRVYGWKTKQHAWAELHTPQLIGAIKGMASMHDVPVYMQGAGLVKPFFTNDKLKEYGFYQKGSTHARDAVRHGCYFLIFSKQIENGRLINASRKEAT